MLSGENVTLRPVEEDDLPLLVEWKNNREFANLMATYSPVTLTREALKYELDQEDDRNYTFIIVINDQACGYCGIKNIDWKSRRGECFIRMSAREVTGKGYGKKSMQLLLMFGFKDLNLNRIFLSCYTDNNNALALYKSLNFKQEGTLRQHNYSDGQYKDMHILGLLKPEW